MIRGSQNGSEVTKGIGKLAIGSYTVVTMDLRCVAGLRRRWIPCSAYPPEEKLSMLYSGFDGSSYVR